MSTIDLFIAYAFVFSIFTGITLAVAKDMPILKIFAPIHSYPGLLFSVLMVGISGVLCGVQLMSPSEVLGEPLTTWAALLALIYFWVCISYHLKKSHSTRIDESR